ncbi:hypothetical protein TEA_027373 [Camellia sinensis var. sinensis]|uniref:Uncharacterized protein n=1 Tax=Camellia sinensis var. sinensis TaxID=542762 RepID=A0A4S4DAU5_CAMSN|nr:hypothetical protein TEA_027373 [Camellia sinensis var. sinensis]
MTFVHDSFFVVYAFRHRDIRNWIRSIEQHASDNVNKILVGNKADMDESKRVVPTSKGQARAHEYGIKFFETSAKTNLNVEQVFFSIARDIKQRLADTDSRAEDNFSSSIPMDGKTELQILSFQAPKIRLLRSLCVEGNETMQILDRRKHGLNYLDKAPLLALYFVTKQLVPGGSPDPECVVVCKIAFVSAVRLADLKKNADEQESLVFATLVGDLQVGWDKVEGKDDGVTRMVAMDAPFEIIMVSDDAPHGDLPPVIVTEGDVPFLVPGVDILALVADMDGHDKDLMAKDIVQS